MAESSNQSNHPLDSMARKFDSTESALENATDRSAEIPAKIDRVIPTPKKNLTLSPRKGQVPSLLLDANLHVAWQNKAAIDQLWPHASAANNGSPNPDIFDLIFDPQFQRRVDNWRQWVQFFVQQGRQLISEDQFLLHIDSRQQQQKEIMISMLGQIDTESQEAVFTGRLEQLRSDETHISFWVVGTDFQEGRYFIFDPFVQGTAMDGGVRTAELEQRFETLRRSQHPIQMAFHLLAARLNKADVLRTEMLAEEYSRLLKGLYQLSIGTIQKYGGIFDKHTSSGFVGYFLPNQQHQSNPMQIIECALDLKAQMVDLGREWKIRKGWLHDIELNIAVHCGKEYLGAVPSALGDNVATFGHAFRECTHLCRLAGKGQIWSTKQLINQMKPDDQKKLRFGIFRQDNHRQVLISKYFSRLKDLGGIEQLTANLDADLCELAVTQIFDRQL